MDYEIVKDYRVNGYVSNPTYDKVNEIIDNFSLSIRTIRKLSNDAPWQYNIQRHGYIHIIYDRNYFRVCDISVKGPEENRRIHLCFYKEMLIDIEYHSLIKELNDENKVNFIKNINVVEIVLREDEIDRINQILMLLI